MPLELQNNGKIDDALLAATKAAELVPGNLEYITMAEVLRQQIVQGHLEEGNRLAADGRSSGALQHFRSAQDHGPAKLLRRQRHPRCGSAGLPIRSTRMWWSFWPQWIRSTYSLRPAKRASTSRAIPVSYIPRLARRSGSPCGLTRA